MPRARICVKAHPARGERPCTQIHSIHLVGADLRVCPNKKGDHFSKEKSKHTGLPLHLCRDDGWSYHPQARFHIREHAEKQAGQYILIYCVEEEGWYSLGRQKQRVRQF